MSLDDKTAKSLEVIQEAYDRYSPKMGLAFTGGKDSTVLLHLTKTLFDEVPMKAMFIDVYDHFPETHKFVEKTAAEWNLDLIKAQDPSLLPQYKTATDKKEKREISRMMKINAINQTLEQEGWKALMVGIRWDEHPARSSETYFSPREDHMRVHPILHFTEKDVWSYIRRNNVPYNPLYDKGYRSLGAKIDTEPVEDPDAPERAGREKEKEKIMERLRELGYF
jgi:phosphoadenosine phosphosulfate reductase